MRRGVYIVAASIRSLLSFLHPPHSRLLPSLAPPPGAQLLPLVSTTSHRCSPHPCAVYHTAASALSSARFAASGAFLPVGALPIFPQPHRSPRELLPRVYLHRRRSLLYSTAVPLPPPPLSHPAPRATSPPVAPPFASLCLHGIAPPGVPCSRSPPTWPSHALSSARRSPARDRSTSASPPVRPQVGATVPHRNFPSQLPHAVSPSEVPSLCTPFLANSLSQQLSRLTQLKLHPMLLPISRWPFSHGSPSAGAKEVQGPISKAAWGQ